MKLRIIVVQAGNEIKIFQMTLGIFFFLPGILQTVVSYDSFEWKILILL